MPRIENPKQIALPQNAEAILQKMFPEYQRVVITDDFSALSYSGSWVIRVHPFKSTTPELPVVIKIASASLIEKEWRAYQGYVQNQLPGIAELRGQPVFFHELAGLCYPLMGGGVFGVKSLREYCLDATIDDIRFVLERRLFQIMKERVLRPSQIEFDLPLQAYYDAVLPVNLLIEPSPLPAGKVPTLITPHNLPRKPLQPGDPVRVERFIVIKVDLRNKTVSLDLPPNKANTYRLRLSSLKEIAPLFEPIPPTEGVVIETRQSRFEDELEKALGFSAVGQSVKLPDGRELPNPLRRLAAILSDTRHLKTGCIHGDLNLENVLVDSDVRDVRLIDFAEARRDHVLHDFLRLEMEIVTKVISLALAQANLPPQLIYAFYEELHCTTLQSNRTPQLPHKVLEKPFAIIKTIRQAAREGFYNSDDFSEYYQGLTLYLLGALKFRSLEGYAMAKQLAFWGAATIQYLLQSASPCDDLTSHFSPLSLHTKLLSRRKKNTLPLLSVKPKPYHNLPQPDYGRFVGRQSELAKVARILRPYPHSQHPLVTIDGIGGIGKSVLALEIAHRYRRHYERIPVRERFEAIIWTNAKQVVLTSEGIVSRSHVLRTLDDIYNAIAVTLQREDIIRTQSEAKAELVRNALTEQRTLLIVDNLETVDDETVLEFLRELPAPTKAIVTTRHRIDVAYPIRLLGMPWENAKELMAQECEKKGVTLSHDDAHQLYQRTGGVPLAIVWSIAQIGLGHGTKTVLTRLGQPNSDIARFCFSASVSSLRGKPAYNLLMALSLFVTDASREALGAVTDLPELDRDDGLVVLEKLSLINKSGPRFSLLPLTESYALAQLKENTDLASFIQLKMIHYFLALSHKLGGAGWRLYHILDEDVKNIKLVMEWAYQLEMWREFGEFVDNLRNFLHKRGLWNELVGYAEMAVELGEKIGNKRIIMNQKLFGLGWIKAIRFREFESALKSIEEGKEIALQLGDEKAYAAALRSQGVIYRELGEYDNARVFLQGSLERWRRLNNSEWEIKLLGSLAENEWKMGNLTHALGYCTNAYQKSKEIGDIEQVAINLRRLSEIFQSMGKLEEAQREAAEALRIFEQINVASAAARCHIILAEVENSLGRVDEAKKHAKIASEIAYKLRLTHRLERARKLLDTLNQAAEKS